MAMRVASKMPTGDIRATPSNLGHLRLTRCRSLFARLREPNLKAGTRMCYAFPESTLELDRLGS